MKTFMIWAMKEVEFKVVIEAENGAEVVRKFYNGEYDPADEKDLKVFSVDYVSIKEDV
jgi:hypothetical protein